MPVSSVKSAPRHYVPERIWQARRAFFESGVAPVGAIDDSVLRSWRRCADSGRSSTESVSFDPVERSDLSRLLESQRDFLQAARPALAALAVAVSDAGYAALLTDAQGRALLVDGGVDRRSVPLRQAFRPGVDLSEMMIGTSAMSAAMSELRSVSVLGAEHYFSDNQIFHCCAAPVLDPVGRLLGSVDVSRDMPGLGAGVLALTQHCARQIERALFDAMAAHLRLRLSLPGTGEDAWLAFDSDARLLAATSSAVAALDLPEVPVGSDFQALFDTRIDAVLQSARHGRPVQLRPRGGAQMSAVALVATGFSRAPLLAPMLPAKVAAAGGRGVRFGDAAFEARLAQAVRAHDADLPVLITGETGTGKEVVARAIHQAGKCSPGPFVALNCGAIAPQLMAAELFGHVEGAFTGARRGGSPGKVEAAHGGTLLLDEIGDMPMDLQVGLLRLLDNGEVVRVGGTQARRVDVRFVCATHRHLPQRVAEGSFREDLYYRISGFTLQVPALRERSDFDGLLEALLDELGCDPARIDDATRRALRSHPWPGNVRQLRHQLRVALALSSPGEPLQVECPPALAGCAEPAAQGAAQRAAHGATQRAAQPPSQPPGPRPSDPLDWQQVQARTIDEALQRAGGNVTAAAALLGIGRATLYRKLRARQAPTAAGERPGPVAGA